MSQAENKQHPANRFSALLSFGFAGASVAFFAWAFLSGAGKSHPKQLSPAELGDAPPPEAAPATPEDAARPAANASPGARLVSNRETLAPDQVRAEAPKRTDAASDEAPLPETAPKGKNPPPSHPAATDAGADADAEDLLNAGKPEEALQWLRKAELPRSGPRSFHWVVVEARVLAAQGKWDDAKERFQRAAEAGDDSTPEVIRNIEGAPVDGAFGELWCKAKGEAKDLPADRLKEIADCEYESWGRAMAALCYAEQCMGLFPKGVCLAKALPYYAKALASDRLERAFEANACKGLNDCVNATLLDPAFLADEALKPVFHEVAPGESIHRIAKTYGVDPGQLCRINKLDEKTALYVGKRLKILPGTVTIKVSKGRLQATLYIGELAILRVPVCIGPGEKTPAGTFTIRSKVVNPDWYYNGKRYPFGTPENILGTRWLGLDGEENGGKGAGIGLHGTAKPESIPGRESLGCVRFLNTDIEMIYDFLPLGGSVEIAD
ncbi:MAG: L,D-transpeptidase family protein [Planctomycetes bacterium]|nr:L,D-transpeptidase family protein [Planctomycetota bacterium]